MIFYWIVLGAAAGFIGTRMLKVELGVIQTIALGIIGALIGGLVLKALLAVLGVAAGFIGALLGVAALIYGYKYFVENRK